MLGWDLANWVPTETHYPDWRITSPIGWDTTTGFPI